MEQIFENDIRNKMTILSIGKFAYVVSVALINKSAKSFFHSV